jgi:hypothetical protein
LFSFLLQLVGLTSPLLQLVGLICLMSDTLKKTMEDELATTIIDKIVFPYISGSWARLQPGQSAGLTCLVPDSLARTYFYITMKMNI